MEEVALAALDLGALARDAADLVRIPSVTGDERAALELVAERADAAGLAAPSCTRTTSRPCARTPTTRARRPRATSCGA